MSPRRRILAPICRLLGHRFAESMPSPYVDRCQRCGAWVWGESMTAVLAMLAPHDGSCDECPHEAPDESTPPPPDPEVSP